MLRLFLRFELQKISSYFKTNTLAKTITTGMFLAVFLFVGVGLYFFFLSGFRYVNFSVEQEIQLPLTLFMYELFLLVMAGVIVFSATVSTIFNLFRGQYDAWFISSPKYYLFPRIVFIKSVLTSSWPLFIMFLPAILAFNKIYHLGADTVIVLLFSVIVLLVVLVGLSMLTTLFLSTIYYKATTLVKSHFTFGALVAILGTVFLGVLIAAWKTVKDIDLVALFKADNADINVTIANISEHFYASPTHLLALEILYFQEKLPGLAWKLLTLLILLALCVCVAIWKTSRIFYKQWQALQEGSTKLSDQTSVMSSKTVYHFTGGQVMALFKKEALVLSRNQRGVVWFLFLSGLWLAQVGTNIILRHNLTRHQTDITEKLAVFQSLQFIIAIYFICSFALRFVFPAFSVEKKTAWIIRSAPINFKKLFLSKYLFYVTFFIVLGGLMSYINVRILDLEWLNVLYSLSLFLVTVTAIVTLALSLGALFPSKDTDDPEAISTSMSGLFFTALSLALGGLSSYVLYLTLTQKTSLFLILFELLLLVGTVIALLKVPYLAEKRQLQ